VETILDEAQPYFSVIKKNYPHFLCGKAKSGSYVYYEKVGFIDLDGIRKTGCTIDDTIRHYIFITEYLWRILAPGDTDKTVSVFDMTNVKLADLAGDALEFLKKSSAVIQNNYPESCQAMLLVNCPSWFSLLWKMVKPLVNEVTQKKIRIVNAANTLNAMREFIDDDQIPQCYGGTGVWGDGGPENERYQNPLEVALQKFVDNIGKEGNLRSKSVEPTRPIGDAASFMTSSTSQPDLQKYNATYNPMHESDTAKLFKDPTPTKGTSMAGLLDIDDNDLNGIGPQKMTKFV